MSDDFDPKAYLKAKAVGFDPKAYLAAKLPPKKEEPGWGEALGRGALQGATAGFGDEAWGALKALGDIAEFKNTYTRNRDEVRANNEAAKNAHPNFYDTGEIGAGIGTMFIPGLGVAKGAKLLGAAGKMGALGAAAGLGGSDADLTSGDWRRAALDTAVGGVVGAGAGALGQGLENGAKWVGGKLVAGAAKRTAAAEARAAEQAAEAVAKANQTLRSEAGRAAQEAYKPALELRYANKLDTLSPEKRVIAERLLSEYDAKAAEKLAAVEAAKQASSQALSAGLGGAEDAVAAKSAELLQPAAKRSAKELFRSYGEPLVTTAAGNYLGRKLDDVTGQHGLGQGLGTAAGLLFGRSRMGQAAARRLALPGTQISIARALGGLGEGLSGLGRGASVVEGGLSRAPDLAEGAATRLLGMSPALTRAVGDPEEERRRQMAEAYLRGDFSL